MIILDYNGVAVNAIFAHKADEDESLIRHTILNTIRMYNKMFRKEYGQMVIACEGGSWRKEVFPEYKANRKKNRDKDDRNWDLIFGTINQLSEDLSNNFPYKVLKVDGAEADDIIGALSYNSQEFGQHEPIMIVSADKDFIQLHKFDNVSQYSPYNKALIKERNPRFYLFEHIMRGDSSDGVPNVLSPDNALVDGLRQSPITKKKLEAWLHNTDDLEQIMDPETYRNFCRNRQMIDLAEIPEVLKRNIINKYNESKPAPKMKVLNYLIKNRCNMLIECVEEFH